MEKYSRTKNIVHKSVKFITLKNNNEYNKIVKDDLRNIRVLQNHGFLIKSCGINDSNFIKILELSFSRKNFHNKELAVIDFQNLKDLSIDFDFDFDRILFSGSNIPNLTFLNLKFVNIPDQLKLYDFPKLQNLEIHGFGKINSYGKLPNLENFNFTGNWLETLEGFQALENYPNLKSVNISHNLLTQINIKDDIPSLNALNLSYNNINLLSHLKNLSNLKVLDLRYNRLRDLSNINNLPNLKVLKISNNPISNFNTSIIKNSPKLKNIGFFSETYFSTERVKVIKNAIRHTGLKLGWDWDEEVEHLKIFKIYFPLKILKKKKINEYLTLKLEQNLHRLQKYGDKFSTYTVIHVGGQRFKQCSLILLNIPLHSELSEEINEIGSIDELADVVKQPLEDLPIDTPLINPETEFWAHWCDMKSYD